MVKDDDDLSQVEKEEAAWGGPRQRRWHVDGKRAIVHLPPGVYEFVVALARQCGRPTRDLNAQIFAAGVEVVTGRNLEDLCTQQFGAPRSKRLPAPRKAMTHEEVLEVSKTFVRLVEAGSA